MRRHQTIPNKRFIKENIFTQETRIIHTEITYDKRIKDLNIDSFFLNF